MKLEISAIYMEEQNTFLNKVKKSKAINKLLYNIQHENSEKINNTNEVKWAKELTL